jgi:kynurenine formamidase
MSLLPREMWMRWLALWLAIGTSACTVGTDTPECPEPKTPVAVRPQLMKQTVVDLTQVMHEGMPALPGEAAFTMTRVSDYDVGPRAHTYQMSDGAGTHLSAPARLVDGKRSLPDIGADHLVVPLAVLDVRKKVEKNADYQVSGSDIVDWEAVNGPVMVGSVFVVNTGWHKRFTDPAKFTNTDDRGVMHFPGLSAEAAKMLVERDVVGVGIDSASIDPGAASELAAQRVLAAANKYMLESLANLDDLPETGATLVIGVLPIADGTEAPARVLALVPEKEKEDDDDDEGER